MPRVAELRPAGRSKLCDPSPLVRRAAFKAVSSWLEESAECCGGEARDFQEAGDLLRRLRGESAQIRSQTLAVLERVIFFQRTSRGNGLITKTIKIFLINLDIS